MIEYIIVYCGKFCAAGIAIQSNPDIRVAISHAKALISSTVQKKILSPIRQKKIQQSKQHLRRNRHNDQMRPRSNQIYIGCQWRSISQEAITYKAYPCH